MSSESHLLFVKNHLSNFQRTIVSEAFPQSFQGLPWSLVCHLVETSHIITQSQRHCNTHFKLFTSSSSSLLFIKPRSRTFLFGRLGFFAQYPVFTLLLHAKLRKPLPNLITFCVQISPIAAVGSRLYGHNDRCAALHRSPLHVICHGYNHHSFVSRAFYLVFMRSLQIFIT